MVAVGLAVFAAGSSAAQVETDVDIEPDWRRKPSADDMLAVWPAEAQRYGRSGSGVVHCKVSPQGALYDCAALSEEPVGSGFGQAAVALTPQFLMSPAMKDGKAVAYDGVTIPVKFIWPSGAPGVPSVLTKPVVSNVAWIDAPSYAEVAAAFPKRARAKQAEGQATLLCSFRSDGRLGDCRTLGETPSGLGFGPAARTLITRFQGPLKLADGRDIKGAFVQLPITFAADMLQSRQPVIGKPRWTRTPSAAQLRGIMPVGAMKGDVTTVRVILQCTVVTGGAVDQCSVQSEEPSGYGLGEASVGLSGTFRLAVWTNEGLPTVGGRVRIPIRYELPEAAPKTP